MIYVICQFCRQKIEIGFGVVVLHNCSHSCGGDFYMMLLKKVGGEEEEMWSKEEIQRRILAENGEDCCYILTFSELNDGDLPLLVACYEKL